MWKSSQEFGIGRAQAKDGKWLVVANYYPAGNFMGRYKENVLPPRDGKTQLIADTTAPSAGGASKGAGKLNKTSHKLVINVWYGSEKNTDSSVSS